MKDTVFYLWKNNVYGHNAPKCTSVDFDFIVLPCFWVLKESGKKAQTERERIEMGTERKREGQWSREITVRGEM